MLRKSAVMTILVVALLAFSIPAAFAQDGGDTKTMVYTEEQINVSEWVTTPASERLSDVVVDLQPGQVVLSATYTPTSGAETSALTTTLVPQMDGEKLVWFIQEITVNGEPAGDEAVLRVNAALAGSWARYWRAQMKATLVLGVTITDTDITFTLNPNFREEIERPEDPIITPYEGGVMVTLTEEQIAMSYRLAADPRPTITNAVADLQTGQLLITATYTPRRGSTSFNTATILVPQVSAGHVLWQVTSITADGQPASAEVVERVNAAIVKTWEVFWARHEGRLTVTGVTVSEDEIVFTATR